MLLHYLCSNITFRCELQEQYICEGSAVYLSPRRAAGVKILLRSFPTRTLTLIRGQGCGIHHHCRQQPSLYQRSGWYFPRPRSQPPHLFEHVFLPFLKKFALFLLHLETPPGIAMRRSVTCVWKIFMFVTYTAQTLFQ